MQTPRRRISSRDLLRFQFCDDPQVSPDGREVAWVRSWIEPERNRYRSQVMVTDLVSGSARALSSGGADSHPRWSPDGRWIAYLAAGAPPAEQAGAPPQAVTALDRGLQLMLIAAEGGAPRALTNLRGGVRAHAWAPDGRRLAFITLLDPQRGIEQIGGDPDAADDLYARFNRDVVITSRLRWKSDSAGFLGSYFQHLAVVAVDPAAGAAGPATALTGGPHDFTAPAWSPDGRWLATTGNIDPGGEAVRRGVVYLIDSAAPAPPRALFSLEELRGSDLAWSPDGAALAVCGHNDPVVGHYGTPHLWLVDVASGAARCVTEHIDRAVGDYSRNYDLRRYGGDDRPRWLTDGSGLLLLINEAGTVHLSLLALASGELTPLTSGDRVVSAFSAAPGGERIVALVGDSLSPGDLYAVEPGGALRRLTDVNGALLDEVELSPAVRFSASSDGIAIEGWVNPPVGREPGKRYPVILYTGGGPGGMRASVFVHEWQVYTAQGYAVINCNTRGNHGYGQAFSAATRGRWGDLDYRDNIAFLRAACAAFDFIDPQRLAVAGGSYGGYSAAWIIARHPEFKAAVVDRALTNRTSQVGTSDIGFLLDQVEFDRQLPWEHIDTLVERSPVMHAATIETPTLVVHSALDHRCAVEQGEQFYMALKRRGVPAELVRFPDESHELSRAGKPWHRIFRIDRYLDWFQRWL
jgi:dipeptidyl aminopeptidase/acylaminoacyl peptidase